MSLVNQVLRDLQNRQVSPATTGLQSQIRPVASGPSRLTIGFLILGAVLLAVSTTLVFTPSAEVSVPIELVTIPSLVEPAVPVVMDNGGFKGVKLAAVRLSETKTHTRLVLEFSKPLELPGKVLYAEHKMTILLPELVSPILSLPQPEGDSQIVRRLNLLQVDHLWQLQVEVSRTVRFETFTLEADAEHGERLVLDVFPTVKEEKKVLPAQKKITPALERKTAVKHKPLETVTKHARISSPTEKAQDFYLRGIQAAKEERGQESLKYWQQALRLQPDHLLARKQMIFALLPTNQNLADGLFTEGLTLHDPLELRKWYARKLLPAVGAAQAVTVLGGQEVSVAQDSEYKALQAGLWQQVGAYELSRQGYLDLLKTFPEKGLYLFGLAVAYDQLADEGKAYKNYQRVMLSDVPPELKSYTQGRLKTLAPANGVAN